GRLVALRFRRKMPTMPSRSGWGRVRRGELIEGLIVWGRKASSCRRRLYETFPLSRVRMGRLTAPDRLTVWATLLGGCDAWPVAAARWAPPAQRPAVTAALSRKQGLSATTASSALSKTESA